jgi:Flp pilus assembly protein TadG
MQYTTQSRLACRLAYARARLARWRADTSGAAGAEFAAVAFPFLIMVLGIMGSGLQFFSQNAIEHGVEVASRVVRTGQAQTSNQLMSDFRTALCAAAGSFIKCDDAHLRILVTSVANWSDLVPPGGTAPPACVNGSNNLASSTGSATDKVAQYAGGSGAVVVITACYKWDITTGLFLYSPTKLADGTILMQATTAFRTEPYSQ